MLQQLENRKPEWQKLYDPINDHLNLWLATLSNEVYQHSLKALRLVGHLVYEVGHGGLDSYSVTSTVGMKIAQIGYKAYEEKTPAIIPTEIEHSVQEAKEYFKKHPIRTAIFIPSLAMQFVIPLFGQRIALSILNEKNIIAILPKKLIPADWLKIITNPYDFLRNKNIQSAKILMKNLSGICNYLPERDQGGILIEYVDEAVHYLHRYVTSANEKNLQHAIKAVEKLAAQFSLHTKLSDLFIKLTHLHFVLMACRGIQNNRFAFVQIALTVFEEISAQLLKMLERVVSIPFTTQRINELPANNMQLPQNVLAERNQHIQALIPAFPAIRNEERKNIQPHRFFSINLRQYDGFPKKVGERTLGDFFDTALREFKHGKNSKQQITAQNVNRPKL